MRPAGLSSRRAIVQPSRWQLLVLQLLLAKAAAIEGVASRVSASSVLAGAEFWLRCRADGPAGLAVRLACPLAKMRFAAAAASSTVDAPACFEDCRRPLCADPTAAERCRREAPDLLAVECRLWRNRTSPSAGTQSVTVEYRFPLAGSQHTGNYTCQYMHMQSASAVEVVIDDTATSAAGTAAGGATPRPAAAPEVVEDLTVNTTRREVSTRVATVPSTAAVTKATKEASAADDWFKTEIYGPITMGHVIVVSLVSAIVLISVSLVAGLVTCYCRRRSRKRQRVAFESARTASWASVRQQPIGAPPDGAVLVVGDASWTSSAVYADADSSSSPLIGGVRNGFGSQGAGINGGGGGGGSFLSRDQLGRHSFHSVRQQQQHQVSAHHRVAAAAAAITVPESILLVVAEQRAEIDRLSQQLRSSQNQLSRLVASNTDLHRCLSPNRLRHASGPQSPSLDEHGDVGNGLCGSSVDALTAAAAVETIDEEFEADGTLRAPARKRAGGQPLP